MIEVCDTTCCVHDGDAFAENEFAELEDDHGYVEECICRWNHHTNVVGQFFGLPAESWWTHEWDCPERPWQCNMLDYNDGDLCHCGCGELDPDCGESPTLNDCDVIPDGCDPLVDEPWRCYSPPSPPPPPPVRYQSCHTLVVDCGSQTHETVQACEAYLDDNCYQPLAYSDCKETDCGGGCFQDEACVNDCWQRFCETLAPDAGMSADGGLHIDAGADDDAGLGDTD